MLEDMYTYGYIYKKRDQKDGDIIRAGDSGFEEITMAFGKGRWGRQLTGCLASLDQTIS